MFLQIDQLYETKQPEYEIQQSFILECKTLHIVHMQNIISTKNKNPQNDFFLIGSFVFF